MSMGTISLAQQIEEAEFSLRARKSMYDRDVARGTMRESVRELHLARQNAIVATLRWLQSNEVAIRAAVAARKAGGRP